jgi:hypothetical protein
MARTKTLVPYQRPIAEVIRATKVLQAKAEQATDKAEQYYITVGRNLEELKERKPKGTLWPAFVKKHFGYSQPRADELIRIADGRTTLDESRAGKRERVRKAREDTVLRSIENTRTVEVELTHHTVTFASDGKNVSRVEEPATVVIPRYVRRAEEPPTVVIPRYVHRVEEPSSEADELKPGDEGYDAAILQEKLRGACRDAIDSIRRCTDGDNCGDFEKTQIHKTMQELSALQELLQEVYETLPDDDSAETDADIARLN